MRLPVNNLYIRFFEEYIERTEGFSYQEVMNNKKVIRNENEKNILSMIFKAVVSPSYYLSQNYENLGPDADRSFFDSLPIVGVEMPSPLYNDEKNRYIISYGGCLAYLDYLELKHSLEFSKEAQKQANNSLYWAKVALIVTSIVGVVQVAVQMWK